MRSRQVPDARRDIGMCFDDAIGRNSSVPVGRGAYRARHLTRINYLAEELIVLLSAGIPRANQVRVRLEPTRKFHAAASMISDSGSKCWFRRIDFSCALSVNEAGIPLLDTAFPRFPIRVQSGRRHAGDFAVSCWSSALPEVHQRRVQHGWADPQSRRHAQEPRGVKGP